MAMGAKEVRMMGIVVLLIIYLSLSFSLVGHIVSLSAYCLVSLLPNFRRVHLTVAALVVMIVAVMLPAIIALAAGFWSVAPTALFLCCFGMCLWSMVTIPPLPGLLFIPLVILPVLAIISEPGKYVWRGCFQGSMNSRP